MIAIDGVEMVDVREAAELVHRTPETVRRWVWTGRLRAIKHGNKLMLRRQDLLGVGQDVERTAPAPTLASWARKVHATGAAGTPGGTSRDLVLEDRAERQEGSAGAGR